MVKKCYTIGMTKKVITIYSIVLIILIALGFIIGADISRTMSGSGAENTTPASTNVTYYCNSGAIQAAYAADSVELYFSTGAHMILPQVISGSGIKYQASTTVFWSEGNNAFVTQGSSTVYDNCVAGIQKQIDPNTLNYTDESKTFSFNYPNQFMLAGGGVGYSEEWAEESTSSGMLFAVVSIPRSFMPGTNFADAKFTVGASSDPDAVANCSHSAISGNGKSDKHDDRRDAIHQVHILGCRRRKFL